MRFYLILLMCFFSLFEIQDLGFSLNYGDLIGMFLAILIIIDFFKGKIEKEIFTNIFFIGLFIFLISGLINLVFLEGPFLNIFRTSIFSLIFFLWTYNFSKSKKITNHHFILSLLMLFLLFIYKTWGEIYTAWILTGGRFSNVNIFDSSLNLNTWGYIIMLFLVLSLYSWSLNIFKFWSLPFSLVLIVFILLSFSRAAYGLTGLLLFWVLLFVKNLKLSTIIVISSAALGLVLMVEYLSLINVGLTESALYFFSNKANDTGTDILETRIYLINIMPIIESYENFNIFQVLFGDAISVQHSWLSNYLVMGGVLGFCLFVYRFYILFIKAYKYKKTSKAVVSKFLMIFIVILIINDFITNVTLLLPIAGYLTYIILGYFAGQLDIENEKTSFNISNRI